MKWRFFGTDENTGKKFWSRFQSVTKSKFYRNRLLNVRFLYAGFYSTLFHNNCDFWS